MGKLPTPNKELGQHFLKDMNVIEKITQNFHEECDVIVEIGPGPAILTKFLAKHNKDFHVIEKDTRFEELLKEQVQENRINFEDALKFDWDSFIEKEHLTDKKIWLVSNLPYNISAPLFMGFQKIPQVKYMTLMFQKEVGEKTYFKDGAKNQMGSLLAISNNYFKSSLLLKVLPGAFNPPPKVDSVVISYERKEDPTVKIRDFSKFESFLRTIFRFKRKQLGSVLKSNITDVEDFFSKTEIKRTVRAESLKLDEIYELFNLYNTYTNE
jgi:16S rRNA (adenine1518-N6/adenine1519-N6)-dimethyltransferase